MTPLYAFDSFGYPTAMALATLLGLGFGFVLERAGFGRAATLAAQFYGRDNRVLKVMFSAIATATAGLGLLGGLGLVELGVLAVPGTWLAASVGGGLLLGAGFVISGYCPGTALVATGSGNVDGVASIGGVMLGALAFAVAWPLMEGLYLAADLGQITLPGVLGSPWSIVAAGVVAMAVAAFAGAEWMERALARRDGGTAPDATPRDRALRNRALVGIGAVALLGVLAGVVQTPEPPPTPQTAAVMGVSELAERLIERPSSVWLVDLREPEDCARERIPGALCLPADGAPLLSTLPPTRTLVLYGPAHITRPDEAAAFEGPVALLDGGFAAFDRLILSAPRLGEDPTPAAVAAYTQAAALHAHYTGSNATAPPPPPPKAVKRAVKKGGGC